MVWRALVGSLADLVGGLRDMTLGQVAAAMAVWWVTVVLIVIAVHADG